MKVEGFFHSNILLGIGLILILVSNNLNWSKDYWKGILEADARGYYAYLPAFFIYQDLNFSFYDTVEKKQFSDTPFLYEYRESINGGKINKYYWGTALVCMPFFILAHGLSILLGFSPDGYSKLYPIFINIAAIFYLLAGVHYLRKVLSLLKCSDRVTSFTLILIAFATNIFYYTVIEPGMSHVYSFAFITFFIYYSIKLFNEPNFKYALLLSIILGIIFLIRPVNILVVFSLPFLSQSSLKFIRGLNWFKLRPRFLLFSFFLFALIIASQYIIYNLSIGQFFVYSYKNEGFNFLDPQIFNFLFSYRKGLFLYTPLYFLSLLGFVVLWRENKFQFLYLSGFILILVYILSSWWNWYYGGSFSSRVMVDYLSFFGILISLVFVSRFSVILKRIYAILLMLTLVLCQIQTYQYRYNQIHWEDMNKDKYWDVFLRIDKLL